jgi:UDP-N-acetylmuramoylalanine--D-glutamate ligase
MTKDGLAGARVLVVGLGRSGQAAARFLVGVGARVTGFDENQSALRSRGVATLKLSGVAVASRPAAMRPDLAVVSPGIGDEHPLVESLRGRGVPVVDELDLASQFLGGPMVAVTGTNGKSTTTALIAAMLEKAGHRVFCGGNLAPGQPLSHALLAGRFDFYVVEASSFQLARARWLSPKVAVILNVSADHLNRHGTLARYAECKFRILDRQAEGDHAVLNWDDRLVRAARSRGRADKHFFSLRRRVHGAYLAAGMLRCENDDVLPAGQLSLPGVHNIQNCLAATAAARLLGAGFGAIRRTLKSFQGLPHRLEPVRRLRGVEYINGSMTTNPSAGARSLEAVASSGRGVILIVGGREKGLPTMEYTRAMVRHAKYVFLIGESGVRMARELAAQRFARCEVSHDLATALPAARAMAGPGDAVLFAPGFASFDQFRDFEDRGRAFRREVAKLA